MTDNPFDRFDLDPLAPADALTERLREIAEDAADPGAARAVWERLTLHAHERVRFALSTFIEERETVASAPRVAPSSGSEAASGRENPLHARPLPRLTEGILEPSARLDSLDSLDEDPLLDESNE